MTHSEFTHILNSLGGLSPEQIDQLRRELFANQPAENSGATPTQTAAINQLTQNAEAGGTVPNSSTTTTGGNPGTTNK